MSTNTEFTADWLGTDVGRQVSAVVEETSDEAAARDAGLVRKHTSNDR